METTQVPQLKEKAPSWALGCGYGIILVVFLIVIGILSKMWGVLSPIVYILWTFFLLWILFQKKSSYTKGEEHMTWRLYHTKKSNLLLDGEINTATVEKLKEYAQTVFGKPLVVGEDELITALTPNSDRQVVIVPAHVRRNLVVAALEKYDMVYAVDIDSARKQLSEMTKKKYDGVIGQGLWASIIVGVMFIAAPVFSAFNPDYQMFPLNLWGLFAIVFGVYRFAAGISKERAKIVNQDTDGPRNTGFFKRSANALLFSVYALYFVGVLLVKVGLFHDLLNVLPF